MRIACEELQSRLSEDNLWSNTFPRGEKKKKSSLWLPNATEISLESFSEVTPPFRSLRQHIPWGSSGPHREADTGVGAALWPSHLCRMWRPVPSWVGRWRGKPSWSCTCQSGRLPRKPHGFFWCAHTWVRGQLPPPAGEPVQKNRKGTAGCELGGQRLRAKP